MRRSIRWAILCLSGIFSLEGFGGADIGSDSVPLPGAEVKDAVLFSQASDQRIRAQENFLEALQLPAGRARALRLLAVLEADPAAEVALFYLGECVKTKEDAAEISGRLNQLLDREPGSLALALTAARIGVFGKSDPAALAVRLRRTLEAAPAPVELDRNRRNSRLQLDSLYLRLLRQTGNWAEGTQWLSRELEAGDDVWRARLLPDATEFYGFAAQRAPEGKSFWSFLIGTPREEYRTRFDEILAELAAGDSELVLGEGEQRVEFYSRIGRPDLAQAQAAHLFLKNGSAANLMRYADAAIAAKDYPTALRLGRQFGELFPEFKGIGKLVEINVRIQAGEFDEAEREIAAYQDLALRDELMLKLLMTRKDYPKLLALIAEIRARQPRTIPESQLLISELVAAEKLRDAALLRKVHDGFRQIKQVGSSDIANALGYVYAELNLELEAAEQLIRSALAVDAENSAYLDSLAWVLFRQNRLDEAAAEIEHALAAAPLNLPLAVIYVHAGEIEAARGNRERAAACFRMALACSDDPELDAEAVRAKLTEVTR